MICKSACILENFPSPPPFSIPHPNPPPGSLKAKPFCLVTLNPEHHLSLPESPGMGQFSFLSGSDPISYWHCYSYRRKRKCTLHHKRRCSPRLQDLYLCIGIVPQFVSLNGVLITLARVLSTESFKSTAEMVD